MRIQSFRKGATVRSALMKELRFSRIQVLCFFLEVKREFVVYEGAHIFVNFIFLVFPID